MYTILVLYYQKCSATNWTLQFVKKYLKVFLQESWQVHVYYPERSILDSHCQWGLDPLYFFNASWCHKLYVFTLTVQVRLGTKCRAPRQKVSKINCKFQTIHELLRYSVELLGHTVYYDDMFDFKGGILEQVEYWNRWNITSSAELPSGTLELWLGQVILSNFRLSLGSAMCIKYL